MLHLRWLAGPWISVWNGMILEIYRQFLSNVNLQRNSIFPKVIDWRLLEKCWIFALLKATFRQKTRKLFPIAKENFFLQTKLDYRQTSNQIFHMHFLTRILQQGSLTSLSTKKPRTKNQERSRFLEKLKNFINISVNLCRKFGGKTFQFF